MDTPARSSFSAIIFLDFGLPNSPTQLVIYLSSSQNKQQKVCETVLYLTTEYTKKFPAANLLYFVSVFSDVSNEHFLHEHTIRIIIQILTIQERSPKGRGIIQ